MGIMTGILTGGGGGGGDVVSPSLPVGLTLTETERTIQFDILNNDPANPAVVELAFPSSYLKAVEWDDGTAESPSFAVDPGATRQVSLERGSSAPSYGDPDVTETIGGTLADGATVSTSVTVEGLLTFRLAVDIISPPTFEYLMDQQDAFGKLVSTGSLGTSTDPQLYNCNASIDTSGGFDGTVQMDATNDYVRNVFGGYPLATDVLRNADRTYIFVWNHVTAVPASRYLTISTAGGSNNAWGWIHTTSGSGLYRSQHLWSGGSTDLSAGNGTGTVGAAEDLTTLAGKTCLIAVSWDHAGTLATIRWKQTGHGAGHTYITGSAGADTTAGAANIAWMGWSSGSAATVDWRYIAVIDHVITESEFDTLAGLAII